MFVESESQQKQDNNLTNLILGQRFIFRGIFIAGGKNEMKVKKSNVAHTKNAPKLPDCEEKISEVAIFRQ
jgi:hypothetical protein